jgi:glycosyltransferase involved in cell wall biosynthesis
MKKILILQNEIMAYRKPVYNSLTKHFDVVVLHSGPPSVTEKDRYREIITPQRRFGPFHIQPHARVRDCLKQYDVIVAMFDLGWPAYLLPLLSRRRPKYILWGHRYSANLIANAVRDWLMKKADRLLMYGDEEVKRMIERGIDPRKIVLAPNTMNVPNHKDHSSEFKNSLLFAGRLQQRKRIDIIIESFARLQGKIRDDIVLDIIGSGEIEPALRKLAADRCVLHKVIFHGRVEDPDTLSRLFSRAYAYVSPSPVGLGVLHSFAYGVPVLTIRGVRHGPEFHNLRHNHNAIICKDLSEIYQAIEKVCVDSCFAANLGRNAYYHYVTERPLVKMLAGLQKAIEA